MLTFKRKLILTNTQQQRIDSWIGACRIVYNLGLEIKIASYRNRGVTANKFELMRQVTELRKEVDWIQDVPSTALSEMMVNLDQAYTTFFKGGGFPKWATKRKSPSLYFRENIYMSQSAYKIRVPKIGHIKLFKDSHIYGNIKTVRIKKEASGYYAFIVTDAVKDIQCKDESQVIGLDMGIAKFCTDSNGGFIDNPKHFKKYERQLRIENRALARKKKGGANWKKQAQRLSLLHHKIGNARKDFLHKESTRIAKSNYMVIIEDLNVGGMVKNKNLSKHILDCGWGAFRQMLSYKTNVVAINPKHTSQTCNSCGTVDSKSRISQSEFICTSCGETSNADVNAAQNILRKGIALVREREGIPCALDKKDLSMSVLPAQK